jgi:hypothetical protein
LRGRGLVPENPSARLQEVIMHGTEPPIRIRTGSRGGLGAALAAVLVVGAAISVSAASPPTGLAPGKARGTITVNGKAVTLTNAYAALEPNPFDEKKDDIVVLLTDRPLPAAAMSGDLSDAATAVPTFLRLKLRDDPDMAKGFGGERWIIGNRTLGHEVLKGQTLQTSPDFSTKLEPVAIGTGRVEATVHTDGVQAQFDDKFEYRVSFNAAVKPRRAAR